MKALLLLLSLVLCPSAFAHPANVPSAQWKVGADGTFTGRIRFDVVAFATGDTPRDADDRLMNALLDGSDASLSASLADAAGRFRRGFAALPGGEITSLAFPTAAAVRRFLAGNPVPRLPVMLTALVRGRLAPGVRTVAFRYPRKFDTIIQTVEFPYTEPQSEPVDPGRTSSTLAIPTPEAIARTAKVFAAPRESSGAEGGGRVSSPLGEGRVGVLPKVSTDIPPGLPSASVPPRAKGVKTGPTTAQGSSPLEEGREGVVPPSEKPSTTRTKSTVKLPKATGKPVTSSESATPKDPLTTLHLGNDSKGPLENDPIVAPLGGPSQRGGTVTDEVSPSDLPPPTSDAPTPNPLGAKVATYGRMGFTHILPQGLDHILFVLGLFLLGSNTKALVKQVTAFTVAHSITLALTALGVIHLPGRIIEPVIALSIAFVAVENLFARDVRPWRTAVVFVFGLVHGMGFAEVFADAGLRGAGLLTALLSFNVGVELGQLTVVGLAFAAVGWFRKDPRYRQIVVMPASLTIALVAIFWTVQRTFGLGV